MCTKCLKKSNSVPVTGQDCYITSNRETRTQLPLYYPVVYHVPFAGGSPQKKGVIPEHQRSIKSVKGVSCVNQLSSVPNVTNVPLVVPNLPVGSRLHEFWKKMGSPWCQPQGYISPQGGGYILQTLPDQKTHNNKLLCRSPQEQALHQLLDKNAVELVQNPQSLCFYNQLFRVPKPNNRWHPILDLSKLNNYLKTESFNMETPETI